MERGEELSYHNIERIHITEQDTEDREDRKDGRDYLIIILRGFI